MCVCGKQCGMDVLQYAVLIFDKKNYAVIRNYVQADTVMIA